MRTLISIFILLFVSSLKGDVSVVVGQPLTTAPSATYLVNQNFEGAGYDNSETWTESSTPNEDYSTAPAPLVGSQSLLLDGTAATQSAISPNFGDQTRIDLFFKLHVTSLPAGSGREIMRFILNGSQSASSEITVNSSGILTITCGTSSQATTTGISAGVTYNVWATYQAESPDTALNGIAEISFSTGTTRPSVDGGGNGYGRRTNCNGELAIDQIWVTAQLSGGQFPIWICDKLLIDDAAIGDNP